MLTQSPSHPTPTKSDFTHSPLFPCLGNMNSYNPLLHQLQPGMGEILPTSLCSPVITMFPTLTHQVVLERVGPEVFLDDLGEVQMWGRGVSREGGN